MESVNKICRVCALLVRVVQNGIHVQKMHRHALLRKAFDHRLHTGIEVDADVLVNTGVLGRTPQQRGGDDVRLRREIVDAQDEIAQFLHSRISAVVRADVQEYDVRRLDVREPLAHVLVDAAVVVREPPAAVSLVVPVRQVGRPVASLGTNEVDAVVRLCQQVVQRQTVTACGIGAVCDRIAERHDSDDAGRQHAAGKGGKGKHEFFHDFSFLRR